MASTSYRPAAISLDADALRRYLDGPYREVRELTRRILSQPEHAPVQGLPTDEYRELVLERMRMLAAEGQTGMGFPVEYGGGGDVGASIAAFETLAHGDLSLLVKCGVQFGLWGGALLHLGTKRHHDLYLEQTIRADLPGCFAMTEIGHGSDVQSLGTTATYDPKTDEFVINTPDRAATKHYIGNAAVHGRIAAVFAQLIVGTEKPGVHAFIVPLRDPDGTPLPGVTIEDCGEKIGLNGVDNGMLSFDHVRIPREALLNRYADVTPEGVYESDIENPNRRFFTMIGTLIQGRVCVGGAAGNAAKNALTIAVRHGLKRRQFGPPGGESETLLLDYRTHQRRLLPLLAKSYALHFAQEEVAAKLHVAFSGGEFSERDQRELESYAAGLKAITTWHATETIQQSREACGGFGYLAENRFAALKADTDVFTTFEGDNWILYQLVAKGLLTDYKDQFASMDQPALVRFVAGQVVETVVEKSLARQLIGALVDVLPASDDERELRDRGYQGELLRWREEHILASVARRLKSGIDNGFDPFRVFNFCQDHVIHTARAHVERKVFDAFVAGIDRCEDPQLKEALGQLCDLYALSTIEADRGWYLEHGRLTTQRSKRITTEVNLLCMDVREQARELVDAFGIPDEVLAAPIALP
ncbi:acyl-CoA oxidase [Conexibacter sp. W3-3-2]|uniref:acyl-CoA dehydrogenase family protein n=1 Tax=Conexibacter sp. W3-3-2 TaxID=2675227 RepID=UPI0012B8BF86|nr:acyl-CoA dehydrogenase [Conexibacter sp. W3-3-2]MTD45367.1 acyl-CoA oxidase [Conexibacter sp. W3-3-2]